MADLTVGFFDGRSFSAHSTYASALRPAQSVGAAPEKYPVWDVASPMAHDFLVGRFRGTCVQLDNCGIANRGFDNPYRR
ncbi:MAG TPA: hypothetical protein VFC78_08500 [Tepidisphaeraceae bacterium]|nr:hypothetical protein [Tepidisphaeraceae bacterium]